MIASLPCYRCSTHRPKKQPLREGTKQSTMEGATTANNKVNNEDIIMSTEFNGEKEASSSANFNFFIKDIPETIKLLAASIFVAFILHNFFFRGTNNNRNKKRLNSSHSSAAASVKVASKHSGYAASDNGAGDYDDYDEDANGGKTVGY